MWLCELLGQAGSCSAVFAGGATLLKALELQIHVSVLCAQNYDVWVGDEDLYQSLLLIAWCVSDCIK